MLEFFQTYGADITAILVAASGLATSIYGIIRILKTNKKFTDEIQVTRDGIIEGFKNAKIPSEWKISVSKQLNVTLDEFKAEVFKQMKENEAKTHKLQIAQLKILSYTAASNKLTQAEKDEINDLIKDITDEDCTVDITE